MSDQNTLSNTSDSLNMASQAKTGGARFVVVLILFFIGLASSIYLTDLFIKVHSPGGESIDSFCAVSEGINCVTVANSEYSTQLDIPVSMYGVEYFLIGLLFLLMSRFSFWPWRDWQPFLFWLSSLSLPVVLTLGIISSIKIQSICIMCILVYIVNIITFVFLSIINRHRISELIVSAPISFFRDGFSNWPRRIVTGLAILVLLSQFAWMPLLFADGTKVKNGITLKENVFVQKMSLGNPDAPIKIEEYTDYQCPYCGRAHQVMMELINLYPDEIYITHHDYPLDVACNPYLNRPFHPDACRAALYGRCAAEQDQFWKLDEKMFKNRDKLSQKHLDAYVSALGMDMSKFNKCLNTPEIARLLQKDIARGRALGVSGTPAFFVNGEAVVGYKPLDFWEELITKILEESDKQKGDG